MGRVEWFPDYYELVFKCLDYSIALRVYEFLSIRRFIKLFRLKNGYVMKNLYGGILLSKDRFIWLAVLIIFSFRFIISSTTEIVGGQYDTDALAYLVNAGYWGHSQDPIRPPFFPLLGWLVMKSGIPFRLFLEVAFIASTTWLASLLRKEFGRLLAIAVLVVVILNPYTIRSFTEAQREPVLLILYIVGFSIVLNILQHIKQGKVPYLLGAAFSFNLAFIILTREGEEVFSVVLIASLALSILFFYRKVQKKKLIYLLVIALLPIFILLKIVSSLNYSFFGVDGYRGLFSYEVKLLNQLNRIKSDDALRYAPITTNTFRLALEKSPAFAEFASDITRRDGYYELLREHSSSFVGKREIDPTRTIWAINNALDSKYAQDGHIKALKLSAATQELDKLLNEGALPSYTLAVPYPFDPNLNHWIGDIISSSFYLLKDTVFLTGDFSGLGARSDFDPENFNNAYNRRPSIVPKQFDGRMHKIREFIVSHYENILILVCFLVLLLPSRKMSITGLVWMGIISACLLARTLVTSILFTSVAPVSRYMVFSAPLFSIWFVIFLFFLKSKFLSFKKVAENTSPGDNA